jgi:hypothetical protein
MAKDFSKPLPKPKKPRHLPFSAIERGKQLSTRKKAMDDMLKKMPK